ncbi:ABC transporter ATP-binding protein [Marinomonas flavescens]|uniref:ABC transporter ATP-binding protein n=1 Tax=Marinomonas flavescens TaxID=2529379 RepID=UPI001054670B|nr:ABC transporter ATP-binding protein [Marinomonas flavescens]
MSSFSSSQVLQELTVSGLSVGYHGQAVVHNVSFDLTAGQIGCLLGPSGCGKSTLLRAIAGFESVLSGSISLNGEVISSVDYWLPPEQRQIGMVFQDIALFPHLTIMENIAFGLKGMTKSATKARVDELLELIGLVGYEMRYPHSLSGGQQQRVALARAMAPKPKLLLMDEPFSGLDAKLREELVPDVRQILKHEGMSAILVTHDQMEAFAMADVIAVMEAGEIHQYGTPYQIYHRPESRFTARFVGQGDFLSAVVCDYHCLESDLGRIRGVLSDELAIGTEVDLLVRPDDVIHDDASEFKGLVMSKWFRGSHFLYRVKLSSGLVVYCFASSHHNHAIGQEIGINIELDHLVVFTK